MAKRNQVNPIDELFESLSTALNTVKDDKGVLSEDVVMRIKTTIASGMLSVMGSVELIAEKFMPAAQNEIRKTKNNISTSKYKSLLKDTYEQIDELHYEVIRLGYMFSFHKYEVLINDIVTMIEDMSDFDNPNSETLLKYMKRKFDFHPKQWYKNPHAHIVSFIANCTKHNGGKCKLDKAKDSKPGRYIDLLDDDYLRPSLKEYKEDINKLLKSFNILLQILVTCNLVRAFEYSMIPKESRHYYSTELIQSEELHLKRLETGIPILILLYKI